MAVVILVGCGGSGDPGGTAAPADEATSSAAVSPTPATGSTAPGVLEPTCEAATELSVVARTLRFDTNCLAVPADEPFSVRFANRDSAEHDFAISDAAGAPVFKSDTLAGGEEATYQLDGLAAGDYVFFCQIHPAQMTGPFFVR